MKYLARAAESGITMPPFRRMQGGWHLCTHLAGEGW